MPKKINKLPIQRKLKEDFHYNPATGDFIRYDGYIGYLKRGYWKINYEGESWLVHRLIWKWWYSYDPEEVDHMNGIKDDNRIANLRNVTSKENSRNRPKNKNNTSGFTGVHKEHGKWLATIQFKSKTTRIGYYDTPQEAAEARKEFIKEFYPDRFTERHGI